MLDGLFEFTNKIGNSIYKAISGKDGSDPLNRKDYYRFIIVLMGVLIIVCLVSGQPWVAIVPFAVAVAKFRLLMTKKY